MNERRKHPRYRITLDVEYDVENGYEIRSKTRTLDMSLGGVSIPVNKAVVPGKKIFLKMKAPYEERQICAIGEVVWKRPIDDRIAPEENAGIKFLEMEAGSREALEDYLKDIPA